MRYFVLNENTLDYYTKHGDPIPKKSIDLTTGRGVRDACDCKLTSWPKEAADGCMFGIATEDRTYYLYGFSENDIRYVCKLSTVNNITVKIEQYYCTD